MFALREKLLALLAWLAKPERLKLRLFLEGNLIGVLTGLVVAAFRYLLVCSEEILPRLYAWLAQAPWEFTVLWLLALAGIGYIIYRILEAEPMTSGSGIPQIEGILAGEMQMNWARVLVLKFTGAVLGIGAGLAAAFNAPLAGVIFCLEELTKDFSPLVLMGAVAASVTATTVTQEFFGLAPVFHMGEVPVVATGEFFLPLILLGAFVGVLSLAFNRTLTASLDTFLRLPLPEAVKPVVPLFASCAAGFFLPQILGGGSPLVDSLVREDYGLCFLLVLFLGKFFFTMLCFGSGVPGGIFLPMLVLGALGGAVFARAAVLLGLLAPQLAVDCMVFGMAAYFACVVKSPITGTVLIMEMTGSFAHLLPLILVSMTAYLVSEIAGGAPVYEMLLARSLRLRERARQRLRAAEARRHTGGRGVAKL